MRLIRYALVVVLIASNASAGDTAALSLKLTALDYVVKSGSKIMIQVTTTNRSDHPITYHNTNRCDYSVKVLSGNGAPAPETPFKKQLDCSGGELRTTGRDIVVTLKSGESDREQIEITELYNMSAPGDYIVQVERTFPEIGHFRSNAVNVRLKQ